MGLELRQKLKLDVEQKLTLSQAIALLQYSPQRWIDDNTNPDNPDHYVLNAKERAIIIKMLNILMAEGYQIEGSTTLEYILDSISEIANGFENCDHSDSEELAIYYLHLYNGDSIDDVEDKYVNVIKTNLEGKSDHVINIIVNNRLDRRKQDFYHGQLVAEYNMRLRETGTIY